MDRGRSNGRRPPCSRWRRCPGSPGDWARHTPIWAARAREELEIDPVLDPSLGTVRASVPLADGRRAELEIVCGSTGHGVAEVRADGRALGLRALDNPYREAGAAVRVDDLGQGRGPVRLRVLAR